MQIKILFSFVVYTISKKINCMKSFFFETNYADVDYDPAKTKALLEKYKVLVLRNYEREESLKDFFDSFSDALGTPHSIDEDLVTGKSTGNRWIDITYDPDIMDRYRSAPVGQPLHTDASYVDVNRNIQFFYCAGKALKGGATTFIDADEVVELLELSDNQDLLQRLQDTPIKFSKTGRVRILPILRKMEDGWHFNWNYFCTDKELPATERALVEEFHNFLQTRVVPSGLVHECMLEKNDVVFFHDEYILHGRNSYFATEKGQRSLIKGTILLDDVLQYNQHLPEVQAKAAL